MTITPTLRRALRSTLAAGAGVVIAVSGAPPVTAQEPAGQDPLAAIANSAPSLPVVPGQPDLPNAPGLGQTGGMVQQAAGMAQQQFPTFVHEQHTQAPAGGQETSTQPQCAPNVFVAVPGTFEVNRDSDPNKPAGLFGSFLEPLKATLGDALSVTYINYDSDAGVNGTAYRRSVDGGVRKTLATITDVSERCKDSQIFLGGFSQGAEIAGDVATQIGQRQTHIDPGRVGGVVLFSDPRRDQSANFIVGTRAQQPALPDILSGIVNNALKDPTLAQLQVDAKPLVDLVNTAGNTLQGLVPQPQPTTSVAGAPSGEAGTPAGGDTNTFTVPNSGDSGDFKVPDGGAATGGGLGGDTNTSGGGLGAAKPAAYSGDTITSGHYPLIGPQRLIPKPAIQTAEFTRDIDHAHMLFVDNDTTPAPSDDDVAERYITGGCGAQTIDQCRSSAHGDGGAATTKNPYEADLRAAVDAAPGESTMAKLKTVCSGRMSAEVCGGSQRPKDAVDYKKPKPEGATGIVLIPKAIGDACPKGVSKDCFGGATLVEGGDPAKIPSDFHGTGYWVTPGLENRSGELQSYYAALENQAMPRNDAAATQGGKPAQVRIPKGVSTIVNPADGKTRPLAVQDKDGRRVLSPTSTGQGDNAPVAADTIGGLFDAGWVMGRSDADTKVFDSLVDKLFSVGGCGEMTLDECTKSFAPGSGKPDAGLSTGQINARVYRGLSEKHGKDELPKDFREACLTLTLADCKKKVATDVPGLPPVSEEKPAATPQPHPTTSAAPTTSQLTESTPSSVPTTGSPTSSQPASTSAKPTNAAGGTPTAAGGAAGGAQTTTAQAAGAAGTSPTSHASASVTSPSSATASATASATGQAAGASGTSTVSAAGGDGEQTSAQVAGESVSTPQTTGAQTPTTAGGASPQHDTASQKRVDVDKVTMEAVAGGGISGSRDADFGALTGRVVSPCVPGDIVCSLPENSKLARSLVELGKNVTVNVPELAKSEGATRMGGLLAVQAVDTVLEITGLPRLKLSPETIEALIKVVAGAGLIAAGNQPAGSALLMSVLPQLPKVLPEVAAQLGDLPKILEELPNVPEKAAENLGLVNGELQKGFEAGGLSNPADLTKLPAMIPTLLNTLIGDNSGLLEIAKNPAYYNSGENHAAFDKVQVNDRQNAFQWTEAWFDTLGKQKH